MGKDFLFIKFSTKWNKIGENHGLYLKIKKNLILRCNKMLYRITMRQSIKDLRTLHIMALIMMLKNMPKFWSQRIPQYKLLVMMLKSPFKKLDKQKVGIKNNRLKQLVSNQILSGITNPVKLYQIMLL